MKTAEEYTARGRDYINIGKLAKARKLFEKAIELSPGNAEAYFQRGPLYVPPLRNRLEDLPLLIEHFIDEFAGEDKRRKKTISDAAMKMLIRYRWPGNVRELKNLIERLIIMSPDQVIAVDDLPASIKSEEDRDMKDILLSQKSLKEAREQFEHVFIAKKLSENDYNITQTAKALGLERSHLHKKIKAYDIEVEK